MTFKRHARIRSAHAASVVDDLHETFSGILYHYLYVRGAGVEGIFH